MPELGLKECVDHTWQRTDCFFETDARRTTLDSPYCRVHRGRLQKTLRTRSDAAGVRRIQAKVRGDAASWCANIVDGIRHDAAGSTLKFDDGGRSARPRSSTAPGSSPRSRRGKARDRPAAHVPGRLWHLRAGRGGVARALHATRCCSSTTGDHLPPGARRPAVVHVRDALDLTHGLDRRAPSSN